MPFHLGREPHTTSPKKGTDRGATRPGLNANEPQEVVPMDRPSSVRDEPTINELIAAREQADAGHRLAFPMLFDDTERLTIDAVPATEAVDVDEEFVGRIADRVAEFRDSAVRDLHHLDKHSPQRIYAEALGLVAQCDEFLAAVGDHLRSES